MRSLLRYGVILALIIAIGWTMIPQWYGITFPRSAGPTFDRKIRYIFTDRIAKENPQIVLLGDSTLTDSVNADRLAELTGRRIGKFDVPGSASAYWYLVTKNNIVVADNPPPVLVIIFRDTILTAPGYRVHGAYFVQLDEFARKDEPLLLERSYLNMMNPMERIAEEYVPLYGARGAIRQTIDGWIRYSTPRWAGCDQNCTDASMYQVFQAADLERGQLQNAVATAEQYLYTSRQLNFDRQVERSYLPEIIRLSKEHGIQLVMVRLKNEIGTQGGAETAALKNYMHGLSAYLEANNVLFLDYGTDSRLRSEYYKDSLHLNADGEAAFTEILAKGLNNLLK